VPYPFAHPVAVLPLVRPMGRFAVPSALVIGSVVPDLWYFVPFASRADSHSAAALFWFCLPVGFAAYAMFHLLLKHPLIALLPHAVSCRLGSFTSRALPAVPWHAVILSLLTGALTHIVWDALTHSNDHAIVGHNWLQHSNTALGTAVIGWWVWRKLRRAPVSAPPAQLSSLARVCMILMLVGAMAISASWSAEWPASDLAAFRSFVRSAGMAAMQGFCLAIFAYCVLWHFRAKPKTSA
jgi:hypothetical protein